MLELRRRWLAESLVSEVGIVRVRCIKSARFRLRAYIYAREPVNLVGFNEPILDPV